ncbi:MAG: ABC transporter permease [Clostridiales bacterium]|nr:ABC transporter permease [Candidatus Crickella equi]
MVKSTIREIKTSLARYLAILAIVALGVGFYAGLQMCKPDMLETANTYLTDHKLFDYQIASTYGIDDESVELALATEGVATAEAVIEQDIIIATEDGHESIFKTFSMPGDINTLNLVEGKLPERNNEIVVDCKFQGGYKIGDKIRIADANKKKDREMFKVDEFTIVGFVNSPLYLDYERGTTSIGNGSVDGFAFVKKSVYDSDYYTQMYVKLDGDEYIFSDELEAKFSGAEDIMEDLAERVTAARRDKEKTKAQDKLDDKKVDYDKGVKDFNKGKEEYKSGYAKYKDGLAQYNKEKKATEAQLAASQAQIDAGYEQLEQARKSGVVPEEQLVAMQAELDKSQAELNAGKAQATAEFAAAKKKLDNSKAQLNSAKKKMDKAERTLDDAKEKLDDGQHKIDTMKKGDAYSISREDNIGYSTFEQNSNIVSNIAKIFPAFFFLVAALVCMTTMTRMMEDQRGQVGILKALGYSNRAILSKYMFYSGSAATLGSIIGFFVGCNVFPKVIWHAYTMMYDFNTASAIKYNWVLGLECLAVALLCSMGATWVSCAADFGVSPAQLMRPKTPKAGKRILLERITPLWRRISFLYKVSFRNVFRYKKRFLMMVIGIAGCTALLIAGFGINTTIKGVAKFQYDEVTLYDYQVIFNKDMTAGKQAEFIDFAKDHVDSPGDILFVHSGTADIKVPGQSGEVTLIASYDKHITDQISLHYKGEQVEFPGDGEVVICRKLNHQYGINVGDTVTFTKGYKKMTATVSGIFDNYVGENVYMTAKTYEQGFGEAAEIKTAYIMTDHGDDSAAVHEDAAQLAKYDHTAATVVNNDMIERVDSMMTSLNAVIYVVILCAGLLAFIVLYNLTNINITERIREIATIKVLGFRRKETSSYVFRENIFLTAFGALVGIPLGRWLIQFVIDNINVNMIFFVARVTNLDYLYSVLLTFVFAFIVNFAMQPVLRKISMTESLKSIE